MKVTIEARGNVTQWGDSGYSPLTLLRYASRHDLFGDSNRDLLEKALLLIEEGADPEAKDGSGRRPTDLLPKESYKEFYAFGKEAKIVAMLMLSAERRGECPLWPHPTRLIGCFLVPEGWLDKLLRAYATEHCMSTKLHQTQ